MCLYITLHGLPLDHRPVTPLKDIPGDIQLLCNTRTLLFVLSASRSTRPGFNS